MNNSNLQPNNDKPKYNGKYRVDSTRLPAWNYANNGVYFLTICTKGKECFFGEVVQGEMQLSQVGELARRLWGEIPHQFSNCDIDVFCVMPNHIHGILILNQAQMELVNSEGGVMNSDDGKENAMNIQEDAIHRVSTRGGVTGLFNPMLSKNSVSKIVRWYKGRCTFEINRIYEGFGWQERFYDEIIRNQFALDKIRQYIIDNPINWERDREQQPHPPL